MLKIDSGNVLLKPSHRRQMMGWLKRSLRLGERMGDFMLTLTMRRSGRSYEVYSTVHDSSGDFRCRARKRNWRNAVRDVIDATESRIHGHSLQRA